MTMNDTLRLNVKKIKRQKQRRGTSMWQLSTSPYTMSVRAIHISVSKTPVLMTFSSLKIMRHH